MNYYYYFNKNFGLAVVLLLLSPFFNLSLTQVHSSGESVVASTVAPPTGSPPAPEESDEGKELYWCRDSACQGKLVIN